MDASREIVGDFGLAGQPGVAVGPGLPAADADASPTRPAARPALVTAVDLIRGLGVLTDIERVEVPGATGWFDTDYEGKRDAALRSLDAGADLFLIHVEATDEAGHAGNLEEKVKALEAGTGGSSPTWSTGSTRWARGGCSCCPTTPRPSS